MKIRKVNFFQIFNFILLIFFISSCSTSPKQSNKNKFNQTRYPGHFKYSTSVRCEQNLQFFRSFKEKGLASWYGTDKKFHGWVTANGDIFNKDAITAAHKILPLPSIIKVTNLENNKKLLVMVNDRGPYYQDRILDLSAESSRILNFQNKGIAKILIEFNYKETMNLLKKLNLPPRNQAIPLLDMQNSGVSLKEYLIQLNKKYGYK